ncbi:MAG: hypothetical protein ACO1N9_12545 [Flavobacterium sp.]
MKKCIVLLLCIVGINAAAQEFETTKTQYIFSFTPIAKDVSQVNGLAFGIGHSTAGLWRDDDEFRPVTVNGLNIEVNPLTPFILLFADPAKVNNDKPLIVNNGVYLAVGGMRGNAVINGLSVAVFDVTVKNNGIGINALYNVSKELNGIHISGLANAAENSGAGLMIAPFNRAGDYKGLQLGLSNKATGASWVQIGLFNKSAGRGFQMGLWNINGKRSLPFINF